MTRERSRELLLATRNDGKIRELRELLDGAPFVLRSLAEFPHVPEAEETGETFEENAAIKASFYGNATGLPALADDSGLEVAALGGAPGVRSARYAGKDVGYDVKIARLLEELGRIGVADRRARFVCVAALFDPMTGSVRLFRGVCAGRLADAPRGAGGFGYDPIFVPDGYDDSFGQLSSDVKQLISHRALAVATAREFLMKS
ncbi:MAG: RdgB/HAM1 family non-canonical purine NTP pyrophosphatase [Acidobacteria bacterium]|nr:RdgB/HAM1 family non-canonical purine NTP pyrophosphatase [Acidobacteriota bacterium]